MEKFIYNFINKTKGTISVFLVIILVPMMTMCSLFVDASRIMMARSVLASSADLSLNTVLADFDIELAEIYGMMASCQDTNDTINTAKQYFKDCLVSQGINTLQADKYADKLSQIVGNERTVNDLLGISVDDSTLSISEAENGSLVNTAILKNQIVEFMKYRGPVEGISEIIEKFTSIKKTVKNSEDEAKLIEEMEDYYETENELLEELKKAYEMIKEYNKLGLNAKYISDMNTYTSNVKNEYKGIHNKMFKDLYNTGGIKKFTYSNINTNIISKKYSKSKKPTKRNATDLIKNAAKSITYFKSANSTLNNTVNGLEAYNSSVYPLQYWVQSQKTLESNSCLTNYYNKASSIVSYRANIRNLREFLPDEIKEMDYTLYSYNGVNTSGKKTIDEHLEALEKQTNGLITSNIGNTNNNYYTICRRLKSISDQKYSSTSRTSSDEKIKKISTKLTGYYSKVSEGKKQASDIANQFSKIDRLVTQLKDDYEAWKKAANKKNLIDNDSKIAEENRKVLENIDDETMKNVTKTSVAEIKNRFNSISSLLGNVKKYIDGLKYGQNKKQIKNLKSVQNVIDASGINKNKIVINKTTLENNANASFQFYTANVAIGVTNKNNPDINVNTPALYKYMEKKFTTKKDSDLTEDEAKEQKKNKENEKKKNGKGDDVSTKGSNLSKNEILDKSNKSSLPSQGSGNDKSDAKITDEVSNVAKYISGFFNSFPDQIEQCRDTLYELLYITNMFSYDTYEYEGKYNLANGGQIGGIKLEEIETKYASVSEQWANEDKSFRDNKTLTNHMINLKNNYSYGNEIEYILYGGKNEENKDSAYGTIFAVRYVLNMTYGFLKIYNDGALVSLANAVSAATYGVIPAPLFQIIVVLGLVTAETVYDIKCLQKGMPVPILKDDKTFKFKFSGTKGDNKNVTPTNAMQYSEYIKLFLFVKLISNEHALLLRTADVIQVNMRQVSGYSGFLMKKSVVYYKLSVNCKTPTLLLSLDMISPQVKNAEFKKSKWNEVTLTAYRGY